MTQKKNTIVPTQKRAWEIERVNNMEGNYKPFEVFNEDWAINADGDLIGWGYYLIDCNRLKEDDWLLHLMSKALFDANTFIPAYMAACRRAGVKEVTMKMSYQ